MTIENLSARATQQYASSPLFLQAVLEVLESVAAVMTNADDVARLTRLLMPERVISFKVVWSDDAGNLQHNIGYRVQHSSALGTYKGGLRFDSTVTLDVLQFLAFEQTFKNALTGLPLGGAKGGSDFDPKGKSDRELRNFCRAFMVQLHSDIGLDRDVPAGDIGVSGRELGYMMGMYKELARDSAGVLSGKPPIVGGSVGRVEATGHGIAYFAACMADAQALSLSALTVVISGAGNVAEHTARKLIGLGATVQTLSDRQGYLFKPAGFSSIDIDAIKKCKENKDDLQSLAITGATYHAGKPWQAVAADAYFPCATQNEVDEADARTMVKTAKLIVEGANMPLTSAAQAVVRASKIPYAPGKASNAGGVAVSGFEMAQNAAHYPWTAVQVEQALHATMKEIHGQCVQAGKQIDGTIDYVKGANIAGVQKVLAAMRVLGW